MQVIHQGQGGHIGNGNPMQPAFAAGGHIPAGCMTGKDKHTDAAGRVSVGMDGNVDQPAQGQGDICQPRLLGQFPVGRGQKVFARLDVPADAVKFVGPQPFGRSACDQQHLLAAADRVDARHKNQRARDDLIATSFAHSHALF